VIATAEDDAIRNNGIHWSRFKAAPNSAWPSERRTCDHQLRKRSKNGVRGDDNSSDLRSKLASSNGTSGPLGRIEVKYRAHSTRGGEMLQGASFGNDRKIHW